MAVTLDSYSETNRDVASNIGDSARHHGTNMVIQTTYTQAKVTSVKFYLLKAGSPGGSFVAKVYTSSASDATAVPNTQVGGSSNSVNLSSIGGSWGLVEFTWSADYPILDSGTKYCIYIDASSATGLDYTTNYVLVGCDGSSPTDDGCLIYHTDVWNTYGGYDVCFYCLGEEYIPTAIKKVSGVARASIKKVSGVALASVKKVAGVA